MTIQIPVTHHGETTVIETDAPNEVVVTAFQSTEDPAELAQVIQEYGYSAEPVQYGLRLNYDTK